MKYFLYISLLVCALSLTAPATFASSEGKEPDIADSKIIEVQYGDGDSVQCYLDQGSLWEPDNSQAENITSIDIIEGIRQDEKGEKASAVTCPHTIHLIKDKLSEEGSFEEKIRHALNYVSSEKVEGSRDTIRCAYISAPQQQAQDGPEEMFCDKGYRTSYGTYIRNLPLLEPLDDDQP